MTSSKRLAVPEALSAPEDNREAKKSRLELEDPAVPRPPLPSAGAPVEAAAGRGGKPEVAAAAAAAPRPDTLPLDQGPPKAEPMAWEAGEAPPQQQQGQQQQQQPAAALLTAAGDAARCGSPGAPDSLLDTPDQPQPQPQPPAQAADTTAAPPSLLQQLTMAAEEAEGADPAVADADAAGQTGCDPAAGLTDADAAAMAEAAGVLASAASGEAGAAASASVAASAAAAPGASTQRLQRRKNASPSTSSYKGVTRHRRTGRWEAHVSFSVICLVAGLIDLRLVRRGNRFDPPQHPPRLSPTRIRRPSHRPRQIWDGASPAAGLESGTTSRPGGRGKQLYLGSYDTELDAARWVKVREGGGWLLRSRLNGGGAGRAGAVSFFSSTWSDPRRLSRAVALPPHPSTAIPQGVRPRRPRLFQAQGRPEREPRPLFPPPSSPGSRAHIPCVPLLASHVYPQTSPHPKHPPPHPPKKQNSSA
jgi:hypothetical protein